MSTDPVSAFVQQLRQSQLLDAAQLDELERLRPTATRPAQLAGELVRRGWITSHQANQVAKGRAASLAIGSYIVLEPIGGGGMGQVVKARHRYMHRNVALKLIRQDQRDSADVVERFQRETRLLADLRHPHIVQAYDAGLAGDVWFLAMELLEGTDLAVLVQQRGRLPIGLACEYIRQAALGLQHAHQRGLVHRDIKPSNLFLTAEGVKLLDLGLARPQAGDGPGALTQTNSVMGTPDYLAPEQAADPRKAGARSDLYSLGCTLYFLLSGRPPFAEGTLTQKLLYHQQAEPEPIETLTAGVPPVLAALLRRMLAKRPEDRPANAAEVAAQLAPFCSPASAAAMPAAPPVRGRSLLQEPTVAVQPAALRQPATMTPPPSAVFHSETVLPTNEAPTLRGDQHTAPQVRRSVPIAATVVAPASQPPFPAPRPFPIPRKWLWIGAGGAGALLALVLLLVLLPGKKTEPEEKGRAGSSPDKKTKPEEKEAGLSVQERLESIRAGKFIKPRPAASPTTYLKSVSTSGDSIGQGKTYSYEGNALRIREDSGSIGVEVDGWRIRFAAGRGGTLQVGDYPDAKRYPFNGNSPGLSYSGNGRGSNRVGGHFVVWELEWKGGGQVARLAVDFIQRAEETGPPLYGMLRYNSTLE